MNPPTYELLTTTRFQPSLKDQKWNRDSGSEPSPFLILPYHYARLRDAAEEHRWADAIAAFPTYAAFKAAAHDAVAAASEPSDAYKVRFTISPSGALRVTATPTPPLGGGSLDPTAGAFFNPATDNGKLYGEIFDVRIDTKATSPSIFTCTKTTHRQHYDDARARAGIPSPPTTAEVILYNTSGSVMEGSVSNVAFYDFATNCWYTPRTSTGCLPGVLRRWLLEQNRIRELKPGSDFKLEHLTPGRWVLLINSVFGCRVGRIQTG